MDILLNIIYYIIPFLVLLGILVFVHEFGHFIVARCLGVKVVAFSIGFGKELWSKTDKHGTRWKISAIPLGGYCQFLGDADASSSTVDNKLDTLSEEDKKGAFPLQAAWKKICIVVAGPLFNYLFAILVFIMLFYNYGKIVYPSIVGEVIPGEAAEAAGIMKGDHILSLNGNPTPDFQSLSNEIALSETDDVVLQIERPITYTLNARETTFVFDNTEKNEKILGLVFPKGKDDVEDNGKKDIVIYDIISDSVAQEAGLMRGDILEKVDETLINKSSDFIAYVAEHIDDPIMITIRRPMVINVTLKDSTFGQEDTKIKRRILGVQSMPKVNFNEHMDFIPAVQAGLKETYDLTVTTLRGLAQMITGKRGGKDVGGIIRIAEMSGDISKAGGLISFIYFMALLSVNLGLINLLPIPVLDGGSLIIFIIEMIIGRELKSNVKENIFKVGLCIVLAIMVLATWNDIVHLISRWFD